MKKAIAYIRVSTDKQDHLRQKRELQEYAEKAGILVVQYFEDKQSGSDYESRYGFQDALTFLKENRDIKIILFDEISRMGRDTANQAATYKQLQKIGARVWTKERGEFGEGKEDNLLFAVLSGIAEYEKQSIIDRTSTGRRQVVKDGHTQMSIRKYGYNIIKTEKDGQRVIKRQSIEINEQEAEVVKDIFKLSSQGKTVIDIIAYLRKNNIKTHSGKDLWAKSSILRILHDSIYYGEWKFGKYVKNGNSRYSVSKRSEDELITVSVPAIIEKSLFDKTQKKIKDNRVKFNPRNQKHQYILKGLMTCNCDLSLRSEFDKTSSSRIYRCPERNEKGVLVKKCLINSIKADFLEKVILQELKQRIESPDFLKTERIAKFDGGDSFKQKKQLLKRLKDKYVKNEKTIENSYLRSAELSENSPSKALIFEKQGDVLMDAQKPLKAQLNDIGNEIQNLSKTIISLGDLKDIKKAMEYVTSRELEEFNSADINKHLEFVRQYVKLISIKFQERETTLIRKAIAELFKLGIYKASNHWAKNLYRAVYNRSNEVKSGAMCVIQIRVIFMNNYEEVIEVPYYHKNPEMALSYLKKDGFGYLNN